MKPACSVGMAADAELYTLQCGLFSGKEWTVAHIFVEILVEYGL